MSQHATDASKQAATSLASACATADPTTYKVLLPWLEGMMWRGQSSRLQMLAAAGECSFASEHPTWLGGRHTSSHCTGGVGRALVTALRGRCFNSEQRQRWHQNRFDTFTCCCQSFQLACDNVY